MSGCDISGLGGGRGGLLRALHEARHGLRRLGAVLEPVIVAVRVEAEVLGARVVRAEKLDEAAVTGTALVGGDDAIERALLRALASHANDDHGDPLDGVGCESAAIYPRGCGLSTVLYPP